MVHCKTHQQSLLKEIQLARIRSMIKIRSDLQIRSMIQIDLENHAWEENNWTPKYEDKMMDLIVKI